MYVPEPMVVWGGSRATAMPFRCATPAMPNSIGLASLRSGQGHVRQASVDSGCS
jgi:hypothetical protein